ncbi:MAG: PLD nuclease N-terminal domain-containing protein [Anaerolineales bacterium]
MFDLAFAGKFFTYLTAVFGAFLAALWLSLIFWTIRDIRSRSHDKLVHILAAIVVALFNIFGAILYFILRPPLTLDQAYQQTLEEEALLTQVELRQTCPGCGGQAEADWMLCANCHTSLKKECKNCARLLELPWQVCPYCSTPSSGGKAVEDTPDIKFSAQIEEG